SGRHDLDGAPLVRTVFSRKDPVLAFNDLSDQTDLDEQEGMTHLFEGAVLAIRNPGGHSFPEGTEQRAVEYISLLSLLAYRVQEAKRRKGP
ncbi:MAG: TIGR02391 family protein, partial [Candidatus Binatia bacterium]|nr:TIGR02391 family protein [Candidatus Binatia bacterium]